MNPAWGEFLLARGACIEGGRVRDFGDLRRESDAARSGALLADLSHLSIIDVSGGDAAAFLHGQLSSDVAALTPDQGQMSAWCNPRGQVVAVMMLLRAGDRFRIVLPRELGAAFLRRLGMYVLRSDVQLIDRSNEIVRIGIASPVQQPPPAGAGGDAPALWRSRELDGISIVSLPGAGARRLLCHGSVESMRPFWDRLARDVTPAGTTRWQLLDLLAGIPWIVPELGERFLPQELNLEPLGGLSFTKGCFPGQEIIARVHHRGRPKYGLYRFTVEADAPPAVLAPLCSVAEGGRSVGTVIGAQTVRNRLHAGLAVVEVPQQAARDLRLTDPRGPAVTLDAPGSASIP